MFPRAHVAVFVDGCFWHGCPLHASWPKTNPDWWEGKITSNRARDADTDRILTEEGWKVVRIWEHDLPTSIDDVVANISLALSGAA